MTILGFYSSGKSVIEELLDGSSFSVWLFRTSGRVSLREVLNMLQIPPKTQLPCILHSYRLKKIHRKLTK